MTIHLPDNCLAGSKGKPGPESILWKRLQCIILLWCKIFCVREHKTQGLDSKLEGDPWWRLIQLESVEKEAACMSKVLCHHVVGRPQAVRWWTNLHDSGSSGLQGSVARPVECLSRIITWVKWDYCALLMWCPRPCPWLAFSSGAVSCVPCCHVGCPWSCDRS